VLHDLQPLRFLLVLFAGFVNREQAKVIDYLREENRVLRQQLGKRRLRFTDEQRRDSPPRPRPWAGPCSTPSPPS